jgi:hypothetical protein
MKDLAVSPWIPGPRPGMTRQLFVVHHPSYRPISETELTF